MRAVYIEARPKGLAPQAPIEDFVVEDDAGQVLLVRSTRRQAIDWAKRNGFLPLVTRARHLNDKRNSKHWQTADETNFLGTPAPPAATNSESRAGTF